MGNFNSPSIKGLSASTPKDKDEFLLFSQNEISGFWRKYPGRRKQSQYSNKILDHGYPISSMKFPVQYLFDCLCTIMVCKRQHKVCLFWSTFKIQTAERKMACATNSKSWNFSPSTLSINHLTSQPSCLNAYKVLSAKIGQRYWTLIVCFCNFVQP